MPRVDMLIENMLETVKDAKRIYLFQQTIDEIEH